MTSLTSCGLNCCSRTPYARIAPDAPGDKQMMMERGRRSARPGWAAQVARLGPAQVRQARLTTRDQRRDRALAQEAQQSAKGDQAGGDDCTSRNSEERMGVSRGGDARRQVHEGDRGALTAEEGVVVGSGSGRHVETSWSVA